PCAATSFSIEKHDPAVPQGYYDYIPKLCFPLKGRRYVKELQGLCIWLSHKQ
nr:hypothetical protein [Tanacetum cinerariifolium]